ncbi:MAG TPA: GNAT family N-acetyltransferase [Solirubrobacter sp.]
MPLFCDTELARRIERAETQLMLAATHAAGRRGARTFALPIAGGNATYAGAGSPYNKVSGLGFDGVPEPEALDEVELAFATVGAPVQVELAHVADPAVGALLTERGYRLTSFENVLGLSLLEAAHERFDGAGLEIRRSGDEELQDWLEVQADGVAVPDMQGLPWHEEFPRDAYLDAMRDSVATGIRRYIALHDGIVAGGASYRVADGLAQLTGAATAPAHRRRGIQTALTAARLADAADAGCDIAVVTTQPASKSQQNVQRRGFDLLYTRAVLVKI